MIFFRAFKYLKYIILSKHRNGHGIHSPFVFDLVTRVFRNKIDTDIVCTIEKVRKRMISDRRSLLVSDLGSGSDILKSNLRKVSDIARNSPVPQKYGVLLSNMASEFGGSLIIEFGTSFGISAMYLASSGTGAPVCTMEGCPAISEIAMDNFRKEGIENIEVFTGPFDKVLPLIINKKTKPGLVFIDGNHRKEPVIKYFSQVAEISDNKTVIIIDDIYYSREMGEAWSEIKQSENVSLTIDIYRMGIVFFRGGVNHNDYVIRY